MRLVVLLSCLKCLVLLTTIRVAFWRIDYGWELESSQLGKGFALKGMRRRWLNFLVWFLEALTLEKVLFAVVVFCDCWCLRDHFGLSVKQLQNYYSKNPLVWIYVFTIKQRDTILLFKLKSEVFQTIKNILLLVEFQRVSVYSSLSHQKWLDVLWSNTKHYQIAVFIVGL